MTGESHPSEYRKARIGAAAAFAAATVFLVIFDALSINYEVNTVVLGFLIVAALACLAVDIPHILGRR